MGAKHKFAYAHKISILLPVPRYFLEERGFTLEKYEEVIKLCQSYNDMAQDITHTLFLLSVLIYQYNELAIPSYRTDL